jgi:predicted Zn-dependent peptidase
MTRRSSARFCLPRFGAFALAGLLLALAPRPAAAEPEVHRHVLANGLTLLMVERHQAPVISAVISVKVGGVDEPEGQTGIAHMFEHMAFKGTTTIGTTDAKAERRLLDQIDALMARREADSGDDPDADSELDARIADLRARADALVVPNAYSNFYLRQGAVGLNATTGSDQTRYLVSFPANRLPFWAAMEYDRLAHPVLRQFYTERDVVAEERRMRVDNSPDGRLWEPFVATAFMAHPYRRPVLGWPSDLNHLTRPEARAFYRAHYVPQRMVVALVGDLDPDATLRLVRDTLGRLPRSSAAPPPPTREPEHDGPRRVTIYYDAEPQIAIGYLRPPLTDPDSTAFDVLGDVLGRDRVGRLYRALVLDQGVATAVVTESGPGRRYANLFAVAATPNAPHTLEEVETAVLAELERVRHEPIGQDELDRARNALEMGLAHNLESNKGLAGSLAYFEAIAGDWRFPYRQTERMEELTPEDVRRVAERYLAPERRVVGVLVRPPADTTPPAPPAP